MARAASTRALISDEEVFRLFRPRNSRHAYATEMLNAGVTFPGIMKLLGHSTPEMTMAYIEITQPDLRRE